LTDDEAQQIDPRYRVWNPESRCWELRRGSDGYCMLLDRETLLCTIYDHRPRTCREFHCTLAPDTRGWRLDLVRLDE